MLTIRALAWIYLSPHYDDAVLSCGGMIWEQVRASEPVEIWTIFAGGPPRGVELPAFAAELHARWRGGSRPIARRRAEDRAACALVGAVPRYWTRPDCIYRRLPSGEALIGTGDDLWLPVHPAELPLVERLRGWLRRTLPREARVVCPLGLGNHVDHRIVRTAAEALKRPLLYYADYPYAGLLHQRLPDGLPSEQMVRQAVSPEGLEVWTGAVAAYTSQISSLFDSPEDMRAKLHAYWRSGGGSRLWRSG